MHRIVTVGLVLALSSVSFADLASDVASALEVARADPQDHAAIEKAYTDALKANPGEKDSALAARTTARIANVQFLQEKYEPATTSANAVLSSGAADAATIMAARSILARVVRATGGDIAEEIALLTTGLSAVGADLSPRLFARWQQSLSYIYMWARMQPERLAACAASVEAYPSPAYRIEYGRALQANGQREEGNARLITASSAAGTTVAQQRSIFAALDRGVIEPAAYRSYLERVLLIVPATEENAEFLGLIKSELSKIE